MQSRLKLRLYAATVCSTLTHDSEAWTLTPRALATLYGFNWHQLHRIIGRSYREEVITHHMTLRAGRGISGWATSFVCILTARCGARCWQWADEGGRPTHRQPGILLMDATLPLDQLALPTGQPAHGHNTAAGPTCPANQAACS